MSRTDKLFWNRCYRTTDKYGQSTMLPNYCTESDAEAIGEIIEAAAQRGQPDKGVIESNYGMVICGLPQDAYEIRIYDCGTIVESLQLNNFYSTRDAQRIGKIALEVYRRQEAQEPTDYAEQLADHDDEIIESRGYQ